MKDFCRKQKNEVYIAQSESQFSGQLNRQKANGGIQQF